VRIGLLIIIGMLPLIVWGQSTQLQDPTKPLDFRATQSEKLILNAIITSNQGDRRIVIINGKPLTLGEKVNGYEVKDISSHEVVLSKGQQQKTLKLSQYGIDIKRKVND